MVSPSEVIAKIDAMLFVPQPEPTEVMDLPSQEPELLAYANALLRSLGEVEAERGANAAALKIELDRLRTRYADLDLPLAHRADSLEAELQRVYGALPHRGSVKSRKLAYGTLGTRKVSERLEVTDESVLREELQTWSDEWIDRVFKPVPPKIDLKGLASIVKEVGTTPPGCVLHPSEERFFAKTDVS